MDVWGNEIDGYEINNYFIIKQVEIKNDDDFKAVLADLTKPGIELEIRDESNGFIEVTRKDNGKPILHFYEVNNE